MCRGVDERRPRPYDGFHQSIDGNYEGPPNAVSTRSAQPESPQVRLIIDAATRLFAEHGFDGVGTRQIAAAVGLNIATVHHHVGSKHTLYRRVLAQLFEEEREVVGALVDESAAVDLTDPAAVRALVCGYIDTIVDFTAKSPARPRLYLHHWLRHDDDADTQDVTATLALYRALRRVLERAQKAGAITVEVDWGHFLRSFDYLIYGYFVAGPFDWKSLRGDPQKKASLVRFKAFLHDYATRMLGLPGDGRKEETK